jgi:hypothetical protein
MHTEVKLLIFRNTVTNNKVIDQTDGQTYIKTDGQTDVKQKT